MILLLPSLAWLDFWSDVFSLLLELVYATWIWTFGWLI